MSERTSAGAATPGASELASARPGASTPPASTTASALSALVDGEISDAAERDRLIARLAKEEGAAAEWSTFHLIGDVLRDTAATGLSRSTFAARLANEPTVLAPVSNAKPASAARSRWSRWSLPLAASVASLMVIGWGVNTFMEPDVIAPSAAPGVFRPTLIGAAPQAPAQGVPQGVPQGVAPATADASLPVAKPSIAGVRDTVAGGFTAPNAMPDSLDEYLWAHQRVAPSISPPGAAPYIRLIGDRGAHR